jgi:hypothetical protein
MAENSAFASGDREGDVGELDVKPARTVMAKKSIAALLGLLLLVNLSSSIYQIPLNRVIERRLCNDYYAIHDPTAFEPDGSVKEEKCKIDSIQQDLAWILGAMETAWIVGGMYTGSRMCSCVPR